MHHRTTLSATIAGLVVATAAAQAQPFDTPTLTGWAVLPAATFSDGPTSGRFAGANPYGTNTPPYANRQPVQGFSGVLKGPGRNTFRFVIDNGFGARGNSADALLRMVTVSVDFRTPKGGSGAVAPADWTSGRPLPAFDARSRITLHDPDGRIGIPIQADLTNFYGDPAKPEVDAQIRAGRLLTGADLDIESVRRDARGHLWFGDEFGPYLVETDGDGRVLRSVVPMPGVFAPENVAVAAGQASANLGGSGGFEGMAIDASGKHLWTLLEKTVAGDAPGTLRLSEFDIASGAYTGQSYLYRLDAAGTAIGDMTAIDSTRFIVIERNGGTATNATVPFKKLFVIDIAGVANGDLVEKTELADLMAIDDPHDLDRDGATVFTLPYVTIENVLVLDDHTLLVANDNNFPYGGGRALGSDPTEFLRIALPRGLRR